MAGLPNATYVGFTGTPIDKTAYGKGTFKTFGCEDDKGYLHNLSQTMVSFFPDYTINNLTESKQQITVEHLLAMKTGMHWDESSAPFTSPLNDVYHLRRNHGTDRNNNHYTN